MYEKKIHIEINSQRFTSRFSWNAHIQQSWSLSGLQVGYQAS